VDAGAGRGTEMTGKEAVFLAGIGLRVRVLRTARRLSQDRLAEKARVSRVTLGSIERGEHAAGILSYRALAAGLESRSPCCSTRPPTSVTSPTTSS